MLAALEQAGQLDNTLIIHTSDHGEFLGDYDCFGKRSMLDCAARIPLIARLPDRFAAGRPCATPASLVDVMPTILSAAGVPTDGLGLDGRDLAEVGRDGDADRTVYSQWYDGDKGTYMALNRRYKYYYSAADRREFLFDRVEDPQETRNRAENPFCRAAAAEMRGALMDHYRAQSYTEPLDGDHWRLYPQPDLPADPDAGLLVQDAGWARPYQAIPGYTDGA